MSEAFSSLRALVSGDTKVDVPVPACLNHCINQEVFNCKVSQPAPPLSLGQSASGKISQMFETHFKKY